MLADHLPTGPLRLGAATSSYQIEGALDVDGRGVSTWDTFAARPGTVVDGSDGSTACASYERYRDDVDLLAGLGVAYYRFSVSWPRIVPTGSGTVEQRGLAYYERLVDALLERGIAPLPTLYHWDLPQPLEDDGGWLVRDTAERFADYAMVVYDRLADRVGLWATHNETWCTAYLGYASGRHAPGRQERGDAHRASHHLMLSHGLAAARMHEAGADAVGLALNLAPVWPQRPEAAEVADGVDAIRNRIWLGPLVDGAYDDGTLRVAPVLRDPDLVRDGDLDLVRGSADWLGINYYTPTRVDVVDGHEESGEGGDSEVEAFPGVEDFVLVPHGERTEMGWEIEPRGLQELLVDTHRRTGLPLVVTENGAAFADDARTGDGSVEDQDRIDYLREHLAAVERAREAGADVRAYLVWTLLDNYEWAQGYTKTFGLVHVDRSDPALPRTPKRSYSWVRDYIRSGA